MFRGRETIHSQERHMTRMTSMVAFVLVATLTAGPAVAQDIFIFPQNGQSQEQQNKDRGECEGWARQQTGFDPLAASGQQQPSSKSSGGGAIGGAARGAAVGAAVGAIAGNAGKGAAMGAAGGGLMGGMRRQDQRRDQAQQQQQWQAQQQQARSQYIRALTACLEGKGYTVR
jgi:hypothetical protein